MNAQAKFDNTGILTGRGIEWTHIFGPASGYTANPIRGCDHRCQWRMPDGKVVICYAKSQRDRIDGDGAFENITFHPDVFQKIARHKKRAGIFIDSMSDLLGEGVKTEWILQTISLMHECAEHVFFILTKNPRRLTEFAWPKNALVGLSAPPTFMYGRELNQDQQHTWFRKGLEWLNAANAEWRWASLEPLSSSAILGPLLQFGEKLNWAVIGAGSDGSKTYQPDETLFVNTLATLRTHVCPVLNKGNLDLRLAERHGGWREEWPKLD